MHRLYTLEGPNSARYCSIFWIFRNHFRVSSLA